MPIFFGALKSFIHKVHNAGGVKIPENWTILSSSSSMLSLWDFQTIYHPDLILLKELLLWNPNAEKKQKVNQ